MKIWRPKRKNRRQLAGTMRSKSAARRPLCDACPDRRHTEGEGTRPEALSDRPSLVKRSTCALSLTARREIAAIVGKRPTQVPRATGAAKSCHRIGELCFD